MEEVKLDDYVEDISSQKDKNNSKEVKKVINASSNYDPDMIDTSKGLYGDNTSIYFIPMYKSQYVLVCSSDEPIDVSELQNCESSAEILEIGKSKSPSFRSIAGGRVKADDPLLSTVHSYVSGVNKDEEMDGLVNDLLKTACSQHNELITLIKEEENEYSKRTSALNEIKDNAFSELCKNQAFMGELKPAIDKLNAAYDKYDQDMSLIDADKKQLDERSFEIFKKINDKYFSGMDKLKDKFSQNKEDLSNIADVIVRIPISNNMNLICEANPNVDLSAINNIKSSKEAKEAGLSPKGATIYGNEDPNRPTKSDIFVKYDESKDALIQEKDRVVAAFYEKLEKANKDIDNRKNVAREEKDAAKAEVAELFTKFAGMAEEPQYKTLMEIYEKASELQRESEQMHLNIMNDYLTKAEIRNNLLMEGKVDDTELKNNTRYALDGNELNDETLKLVSQSKEHLELSEKTAEYSAKLYEVDPDDIVMGKDGKFITVEEYEEELNKKIDEFNKYENKSEAVDVVGVPIREGDTIVGFIEPSEMKMEEPKEEVVDEHADEIRISYGDGSVEYVKSSPKESLENLKKAVESNTKLETLDIEADSKTK